MKHIRYYIMALLALPLMASCGDDDYSAPTPAGNPVMSCTAPATAVWMGDEVEVKVNCKDEGGVALSTLKAKRLGGYAAYGPILQGLNAPINDLSRGCNADEVYKMSLITACQS